jgi:hypothetical protein
VVAILVVALSGQPAGAGPRDPGGERDPATTTFKSLAEAARAGAIDPELVEPLEAGKRVELFAVLDGRAAMATYGDGDPARVRRAVAMLAAVRTEVLSAVEGRVEVLKMYELVPLLLVSVQGPENALYVLNLILVLSLAMNREHEHWLTASLPLINQPQMAVQGLIGRGTSVAVLDTGADFTRAAFGSCTAPGTPASCRVPVAVEAAPNDGSRDDNGHGTNVSGIVTGVARGASIIPIDVFATTRASDGDIFTGLDWVLNNRSARNIRAVNMSFGNRRTYYTSECGDQLFWRNPYSIVFLTLRQAGTLPVVAAGNDAAAMGSFTDGLAYPACTAGAVAVGAVYSSNQGPMAWASCTDSATTADQFTCFSQDSPLVDVIAPGASITAAGNTQGGTSQAAPHVAGAFAVLAAARPFSTADELESFVKTSPTTLTDPRTGRTHPRLDLAAAVRAAAPVPNDDRAAARTLTGWGGQLDQTTWTATKEGGEQNHAGNPGGASVWFRWTATQAGTAVFATAGSDFDTLLAAYRDTGTTLVTLAENDDVAGTGLQSLVSFPVSAGDTVLVAVDGKRLTSGFPVGGRLHLSWNLPNDNFAGALPITQGGTIGGANIGATQEAGEPMHCGDTYATASVWYRWLGVAGTMRVQATSTQFLCVAVYHSTLTTPTFGQLGPVADGVYDSPYPIDFTFPVVSGMQYWIAVDGISVETGCNPVTGQCNWTTPTGTFTLTLTV